MKIADINWPILTTFIVVHCVTAAAILKVGFEWRYLLWTVPIFYLRWSGFTCAAHRYFSHRAFRTSRIFQFILGLWAVLTMARAPIRFASGHRHHHIHSDTFRDLHSAKQQGILYAYLGWVINKRYHEDKLGRVGDIKRYPELVALNRYYFGPNMVFLGLLYGVGGAPALVYGGLLSIIAVWHAAFSVTVAFHRIGHQKYETFDDSRNSLLLGLLTLGEGFHNNHHANMASAKMGHEWWEFDGGYALLLILQKLGLIWDMNVSVGNARPSPVLRNLLRVCNFRET